MSDPGPRAGRPAFAGVGGRSIFILVVLFLIYGSDYVDRAVVNGMLDQIGAEYGVEDAARGSLTSVVLLFITIFTVPASILIDRWSRRKMVAIMVGLWSIATLACAHTKTYFQLVAARALVGVGEAGYAPGGTAMISAAFPEKYRSIAMGVWNMAIPLGMGLGLIGGEMIAARYGFRSAFGLVAVPGMALALAAWFLPDYKTVRMDAPGADAAGGASGASVKPGFLGGVEEFVAKVVRLMPIPSLWLTYLGFAMNVAITTALSVWLKYYFERTGLVAPGSGAKYATGVLALVLIGAPLGGVLSDLWRARRVEGRLYFPAASSALAAAALLAALLLQGHRAQLALFALYGISVTAFVAPAAAVTQDVVHPGLRAFSYALCVIVQHLCGDIWSPALIGLISDRIGPDHNGLATAFFILPALGLFASLFFLAAARFYRNDLERVTKLELEAE